MGVQVHERKEKQQKSGKTKKEQRKRNADQGESNSCMSPCPLDWSQVLTPARIKSALCFANAFVHSSPSPPPKERLIKQKKKTSKKKLKQNPVLQHYSNLTNPKLHHKEGKGGWTSSNKLSDSPGGFPAPAAELTMEATIKRNSRKAWRLPGWDGEDLPITPVSWPPPAQ